MNQEEMRVHQMSRSTVQASPRRVALAFLGLCVALLMSVALAPESSQASTGIIDLKMEPSNTQAGGHPNVEVAIKYLNRNNPPAEACQCDDPKIVTFHFPTGFIGAPHTQAKCTLAEFALAKCPIASQIGYAKPIALGSEFIAVPLYNLETHPNQAGQIGFIFPLFVFPTFIDLRARTDSDYGLDSATFPIPHPLVFSELNFEIWGVPADPSNDFFRFKTPLTLFGECGFLNLCGDGTVTNFPSPAPPRPYLQNPTTCGKPLLSEATIEYYNGDVHNIAEPWPATTGCNQLSFNPSISVTPTTNQADAPSGVDVDLQAPQAPSPTTPTPSQIRTARTTLPEGFTINPSAADGKVACEADETGIGTLGPAHCPEASKVGTLSLDSSALPGPIPGAIYLGEPLPGERYRLILAADGFATHVKLAGTVTADPQTGRLTIEFVDLPQAPMQRFNMHFFGSERGLMATPAKCGKYAVENEFVPWDEALPKQEVTSYYFIDSGPGGAPCPGDTRPFAPSLEAGAANATAGMHSPFNLRMTRPDGDQNLVATTVRLPEGLTATLKGVPYCPESALSQLASPDYSGLAERALPACPSASQIGTVVAGAGAGSYQVYLPGKAYLAGPYKGAPISLVVVVPAVSGPYDLGNVAVRVALNVDPQTAQVTAVSDPLPQIVGGVPVRLRSIQVSFDKPEFTLNPTNCRPKSIGATLFGSEGAVAQVATRFQAANCAELEYGPKIAMRLTGGVNRRGHPAIHAHFRTRPGEANTRRVTVTLPHGELLDNAHIGGVCTKVLFAKNACPDNSRLGTASVTTPLLDQPLSGVAYLRSSSLDLPDIALDLEGQFDFELVGHVRSVNGRLQTVFDPVPDVPVSTFDLDLLGGSRGLLQNTVSLCGERKAAMGRLVGQNGKVSVQRIKLSAACSGGRARHVRTHRHKDGR
jgi:hypothetical protein